MPHLIYDVAVSIDGYIAGPDGDVSRFPYEGPHVTDYQSRLAEYGSVIMGRKTYEFGYAFGIKPGDRAYPHMEHLIFSKTIELPDNTQVAVARDNWLDELDQLMNRTKGDVYLCGGGALAGFMLANDRINILRLKRAPIILGNGTPLFSGRAAPTKVNLVDTTVYNNGVVYETYSIG